MAGLWVVFVILSVGLAGILLASVVAFILFRAARRGGGPLAKRVAVLGPFLGLLWVPVAFCIHVLISNDLAHQDCGLSAAPYVTMPNGYVVGSQNTYDGYLRARGVETGIPIEGPGYVRSLVHLQYAEPYFTGTQFDLNNSKIRTFVFDTRTQTFSASAPAAPKWEFDYSDKNAMDAWGDANTHAQVDADSYWTLYWRYRHGWPKFVFLALIAAGEGIVFLLARRAWKATPVADVPAI